MDYKDDCETFFDDQDANKFSVPRSLIPQIGDDFEKLFRKYGEIEEECEEEECEEEEDIDVFLDEEMNKFHNLLNLIGEVALGKRPIYRAISVDNISETIDILSRGCKKKEDCGFWWSSSIMGADVEWENYRHSFGWDDEKKEKNIEWMKGDGYIIMEGHVTNPSAVDVIGTLEERASVPTEEAMHDENEITIKDDTMIEITRLGAGTTVGRARRNLLEKR